MDTSFIQLPNDVLSQLLSFVPYRNLVNICRTHKKFALICSTEQFYRQRIEREYPNFTKAKHLTFEQFYKMLKRYESNEARMFEIPNSVYFSTYNVDYDDVLNIDELNEKVLPFAKANFPVRRGDLIHLESEGSYRNDGKYIYDGEKFIELEFDIDDYGAIPKEFKIMDEDLTFNPNHWINVIS